MAATQRQAATSGVFLSGFHFGPLSKKHVSRDACNPLPNPPPPQTPSSHLPVRGRWGWGGGGKEKDHPHWDHSPSIRPFHTLWTWNNQGLIAAVCLCRPWLIAGRLTVLRPIEPRGRDRGEQSRQAWGCSRGHISKDTHKHSFYLFIPCYSLLSIVFWFSCHTHKEDGPLPQMAGVRVWYLNLFWFIWLSLCCLQTVGGLYSRCVSSFADIAYWLIAVNGFWPLLLF